MFSSRQGAQGFRTRAEMIVAVSQVDLGADHADLELAAAPAFADARVQNGSLLARVRADDKKRVGLFNAGNGRIENVSGTTGFGPEGIAALHRKIDRAVPGQQILERKHFLYGGEIAGDRADPLAVAKSDLGGDNGKRLGPGRGAKLAVLPDVGAIEALRAQTINHMARLVGNPF